MDKIERLKNKNAELAARNADLNRKYLSARRNAESLAHFGEVGLSVPELKAMLKENSRLRRQERDMRLALARKMKAAELINQLAALFR